jgi:hypothetical protein
MGSSHRERPYLPLPLLSLALESPPSPKSVLALPGHLKVPKTLRLDAFTIKKSEWVCTLHCYK